MLTFVTKFLPRLVSTKFLMKSSVIVKGKFPKKTLLVCGPLFDDDDDVAAGDAFNVLCCVVTAESYSVRPRRDTLKGPAWNDMLSINRHIPSNASKYVVAMIWKSRLFDQFFCTNSNTQSAINFHGSIETLTCLTSSHTCIKTFWLCVPRHVARSYSPALTSSRITHQGDKTVTVRSSDVDVRPVIEHQAAAEHCLIASISFPQTHPIPNIVNHFVRLSFPGSHHN